MLLEQQRVLIHGARWVQVRLPLRPAGQIGWVPEWTLGAPQTVHTYVVVSTEKMTLTLFLYRNGKVIFSTRVGTGKASTPTPHGQFYIRDRLTGFAPGSIYGPLAFGTSALSNVETDWPGGGVIGIHGTNEPSLIPGHPSHGCIRVPKWDIVHWPGCCRSERRSRSNETRLAWPIQPGEPTLPPGLGPQGLIRPLEIGTAGAHEQAASSLP